MLARIETNKAAGPTLVTLDLNNVTPDTAIREICKQTGYDIQINPNAGRVNALTTVSINLDKKPFWMAIQDLGIEAGLTIHNYGRDDRRIILDPAGPQGSIMNQPSCISGAFMIAVQSLQRHNMMNMANPRTPERNFFLQLQILIEPRIKVLRLAGGAELDEAVDENGSSLIPTDSNRFRPGGMMFSGNMRQLPVALYCPANVGRKIARLRGKVRLTVQTQSEVLEFSDVTNAKDVTKTVAGKRVMLKELKKLADDRYQGTTVVFRDQLDTQAFNEMINTAGMKLVNDLGQAYRGVNQGGNGFPDRYESRILFQKTARDDGAAWQGDPTTLIWEIPTATRDITVPFDIVDIPLN